MLNVAAIFLKGEFWEVFRKGDGETCLSNGRADDG